MKKIISILLAVCFLVSITAAAASANEYRNHDKRFEDHDKRFEDHKNKHFHPGHWEKHRVGHREFRDNHWIIVYVYEPFFVNEYWGFD